jgi:hypothetical protein
MASRVLEIAIVLASLVLVASLRPMVSAAQRLRQCEEHFALVHGGDLDRVGWLYGTPRMHDEADRAYRKRIALARSRTFAV